MTQNDNRLPVLGQSGGLVDSTSTLGLTGALGRQPDGTLTQRESGESLSGEQAVGWFTGPGGEQVEVAAQLDESIAAGQIVDLLIEWRTTKPELLDRYRLFVHLRGDAGNIAQNDGTPRFVVPLSPAPVTPDWRQFQIPADLPPGNYPVVIGLYDPANSKRLSAFDATGQPTGNELTVGTVGVGPPLVPDQACALIPLACASQITR